MRLFVSPRQLTFSLLVVTALVGVGAITVFSQQEQARELQHWQNKLGLIADARSREVTGWVHNQTHELTALANNPTLQIYFTAAQSATGMPQADYVRNQLTVTAARLGFQPNIPSLGQELKANVDQPLFGGLALRDTSGKIVSATSYMPRVEGAIAEAFDHAAGAEIGMISLPPAQNGALRVGFALPVYAVQAEHSPENTIGTLVGVRPVGPDVFAMLAPQAGEDKTIEAALVQPEGEAMRYLAASSTSAREPNSDGSAAHFALGHSTAMADKIDYRGKHVLVVGRAIPETPWTLLVKIDRDVALAASNAWRTRVTVIFLLLLAAIGSSVTLLWRHLAGRHARAYHARMEAQAELLSVVTNEQPEAILMVDAEERIRFVNRAGASPVELSPDDAVGKNLTQMFGQETAAGMRPSLIAALGSGQQQQTTMQIGERHVLCRFIPLAHVPVPALRHPTPGVLIVEQDITEVLQERSARLTTLNQLVETLVSLIDRREPHTAQRSARIATLAGGVARAMQLDARTVTTTETAARLMHIGKLDVPAEFMTRMAPLNEEERLKVRTAISNSAEMLSGITFDGPVVETLRQLPEHIDGSGPLGLKGEAILVSARILSVANVLTGMMTARCYRGPMDYKHAVAKLMPEVDTRFDRKVMTAMLHYLENKGGLEKLEKVSIAAPADVRRLTNNG